MRLFRFFTASAMAVLLAGCAGYHLGPVNRSIRAGEESVEVLPFNNQTLQPRLGSVLTQALREQLQTDGTYHLATHGPGDVVVTGVITRYGREAVSFLSADVTTPQDYRVTMAAYVTARDHATGKVLLDKYVTGEALVHVSSDLANAERQALPLLAQDLAQNITELLTGGAW